MSEKKVVGRKVAIALGIMCVILVAGLAGVMVNYTRIINDKDTLYNNYVAAHSHSNEEYDNYVSTHHHTDSEYNNYVANHHHTDSEYDDLVAIANLQKQEAFRSNFPVSQGANQITPVIFLQFTYAGYLHIISTATSNKAYIKVDYWFQGKLYESRYNVGTSGDIIVAVLPSYSAAVYVGNTDSQGVTHTVSITYHY
jgi:hypothetical protein